MLVNNKKKSKDNQKLDGNKNKIERVLRVRKDYY
jgi:hypothetical protein